MTLDAYSARARPRSLACRMPVIVFCTLACSAADVTSPTAFVSRGRNLESAAEPSRGDRKRKSLQSLSQLLAAKELGERAGLGALGTSPLARSARLDRSGGEVATSTVRGRVVQLSGGSVAFLPVAILGQGAALTDAQGNFTIRNVTTPYDIATGFSNGTQISMVVYRRLRRTDPLVVADVTAFDFSAQLSGTFSGGAGYPEPPNHFSDFNLTTDAGDTGGNSVDPTTGAFSHTASWPFSPNRTGHLTAVQYAVNAAGQVNQFTGAATAEIGLVDGGSIFQPVALQPVPTTTLAGTYSYPPGYSLNRKELVIEAPAFAHIFLPDDTVDNGSFALAGPVINDRSNGVIIDAISATGSQSIVLRRNIAAGSSRLRIDVPPAPELIFPFSGSTGVDHDTLFLSTEFDRGIYFYQFDSNSGPDFVVVTDEPVAQIPDLSSLGASLAPSTAYSLSLLGIGVFEDIDGFAGPTGPLPDDLALTFTAGIDFTTAP